MRTFVAFLPEEDTRMFPMYKKPDLIICACLGSISPLINSLIAGEVLLF